MPNQNLKLSLLPLLALLISFVAPPSHAESPASFDGHWFVTRITCNGKKANTATKAMYTGKNYISVLIHGENGAFLDRANGCTYRIPLRISYPSENHISGAFNGPIECYPAQCSPACGLDLPLTVDYEVELKHNRMQWTSLTPVDDNCTKNGQDNPLFYSMKRKK